MKAFLQQVNKLRIAAFYITCIAGFLLVAASCEKIKEPPAPVLKISTLATGFNGPLGLEVDKAGRVWVAESGTGNNDGRVSVITKDGKRYDAIVNLQSIVDKSGDIDGPSHLLFADGLLYITGGVDKLYKANVSSFQPGATPIAASTLGVEDIGAFVLSNEVSKETNDSHPYGMTVGPDGDIYITEAGANAIIRRSKTGVLSVFAKIPGIPNPTPVGAPMIESVPTSIIYDGQNFLVTTLLGFPFPPGKSIIYRVSPTGVVSIYQQGFTSLVDIAEGNSLGHLVLEFGTFGPMGFAPNTGRLIWANRTSATTLADYLNLPAGLKQANAHTWYVTSLGENSVWKVTY